MLRRGRYAYQEYNEEEARDWQECYFDSGKAYDHALGAGMLKNPYNVDGPEGADGGSKDLPNDDAVRT